MCSSQPTPGRRAHRIDRGVWYNDVTPCFQQLAKAAWCCKRGTQASIGHQQCLTVCSCCLMELRNECTFLWERHSFAIVGAGPVARPARRVEIVLHLYYSAFLPQSHAKQGSGCCISQRARSSVDHSCRSTQCGDSVATLALGGDVRQ